MYGRCFSGTFKYLVPDISRGPRGPRASANSVGLLSDQNKGEMDWLPTCTASCHMALSTCMVCQWPNYWGFIWKQPGNEFWEMQPTLVYINICQHHFSFIQWLLNRFGTVALPLQSTFVIRFQSNHGGGKSWIWSSQVFKTKPSICAVDKTLCDGGMVELVGFTGSLMAGFRNS